MDENRPVVMRAMLPDQRINWNWLTTVQSVPVCLHSEREGGITSRMRVCVSSKRICRRRSTGRYNESAISHAQAPTYTPPGPSSRY